MSTHWTDKLNPRIAELPFVDGVVRNLKAKAYLDDPSNWRFDEVPDFQTGGTMPSFSLLASEGMNDGFRSALIKQLADCKPKETSFELLKSMYVAHVYGKDTVTLINKHPFLLEMVPSDFNASHSNAEASKSANQPRQTSGLSVEELPKREEVFVEKKPAFDTYQFEEQLFESRNWARVSVTNQSGKKVPVLDYIGPEPKEAHLMLRECGFNCNLKLSGSHGQEERLVVRVIPDRKLPRSLKHLLGKEKWQPSDSGNFHSTPPSAKGDVKHYLSDPAHWNVAMDSAGDVINISVVRDPKAWTPSLERKIAKTLEAFGAVKSNMPASHSEDVNVFTIHPPRTTALVREFPAASRFIAESLKNKQWMSAPGHKGTLFFSPREECPNDPEIMRTWIKQFDAHCVHSEIMSAVPGGLLVIAPQEVKKLPAFLQQIAHGGLKR